MEQRPQMVSQSTRRLPKRDVVTRFCFSISRERPTTIERCENCIQLRRHRTRFHRKFYSFVYKTKHIQYYVQYFSVIVVVIILTRVYERLVQLRFVYFLYDVRGRKRAQFF